MELDLDSLVYTYPSIEEWRGFQKKISAKYEFNSLNISPRVPVPKRGTPFPHQELVKRYMLQYDRLLVISEPGTGKTCTSTQSAEANLRRDMASAVSDYIIDYIEPKKTNIKRVYFLTRGTTLIEEVKYQIICRCTTRYDTEYINTTNNAIRERRITAELGKYYSIISYGALVREVQEENLTDEQITEKYSNIFFIIDEPQYLANPKFGEEEGTYNGLLRIFDLSKNIKVQALTATPMIDEVQEIPYTANLVLPKEKRLDPTIDYSKFHPDDIPEYLASRLMGYISYMRAFDTGLNVVNEGEPINVGDEQLTHMKVYASIMEEGLQNEVYEKNYSLGENVVGNKHNNFFYVERSISNFVFPNGSFGKRGFDEYITVEGDRYTAKPDFAKYIRIRNNLRRSSTKIDTILTLLEEIPGNHFIYSNFKLFGAGLVAVVLKEYKYFQFVSGMQIFGEREKGTSYCTSPTPNTTTRKINLEKRKRFAIITPETSNDIRRALLELFNSYENRNGEYIKVVIASPVGKAGINLSNVVAVHLLDPEWNEAGNYQAISRSLRATSHIALLQSKREEAVQEGKEPREAKVKVSIFRHVAIPNDPDLQSIDLKMYINAEEKDIGIHRMLRILKKLAVDCQLTRKSNIRSTDVDYSPECDYLECNYTCFNEEPTEIDYSSFDVLYAQEYVDKIAQDIFIIFKRYTTANVKEIVNTFTQFAPIYVLMAIGKLVQQRIPLIDRYGKISYLKENNGYLYLEPNIATVKSSFASYFYTENLIALQKNSLEKLTFGNTIDEVGDKVLELFEHDPNSSLWREIFDSLATDALVLLLERAISYRLGFINFPFPVPKENIDKIIDEFSGYWFSMPEPERQIKSYEIEIARALEVSTTAVKRKRGRPRKKGNLPKLDDKNFGSSRVPSDPTNIVYVHILYSFARKRKGMSVRSKKAVGRIRILRTNKEKEWRDTNEVEHAVYERFNVNRVKNLRAEFEVYGIYGIVEKITGKFFIRDKLSENVELSSNDLRHVKEGLACTSWGKVNVTQIMYQLEIPAPRKEINLNLEETLRYLEVNFKGVFNKTNPMESFDEEKAKYFYAWLTSDYKSGELCSIIRDKLESEGRILYL